MTLNTYALPLSLSPFASIVSGTPRIDELVMPKSSGTPGYLGVASPSTLGLA